MTLRATLWTLMAGTAGAILLGGGMAFARSSKRVENLPPYFEYKVAPGDTLTALALRFFGDAKQWPAMMAGQIKPFDMTDTLPVGITLRVPCLWHSVRSGDSLSSLAGQYLRNPARWKRIYEANRGQIADPNRLNVGVVLAIPVSAARATPEKQEQPLDVVGAYCSGERSWA